MSDTLIISCGIPLWWILQGFLDDRWTLVQEAITRPDVDSELLWVIYIDTKLQCFPILIAWYGISNFSCIISQLSVTYITYWVHFTHKQLEIHGRILNTVATDGLVLKQCQIYICKPMLINHQLNPRGCNSNKCHLYQFKYFLSRKCIANAICKISPILFRPECVRVQLLCCKGVSYFIIYQRYSAIRKLIGI